MATTFDQKQFGIKEVADVRFYPIGTVEVSEENGSVTAKVDAPVLALDTLKVSTLEFTAEQSEARGGKGNAPLIIWDYGREVNVTLEDAVMSIDSLEVMYGTKKAAGEKSHIITINANKFPGTYAIVGKTYARDVDGTDHLFTFYIPKAKVQSENTFTMEAEGDPTVFNMSLRVLRGDTNGDMVKFILDQSEAGTVSPTIAWTETKPSQN